MIELLTSTQVWSFARLQSHILLITLDWRVSFLCCTEKSSWSGCVLAKRTQKNYLSDLMFLGNYPTDVLSPVLMSMEITAQDKESRCRHLIGANLVEEIGWTNETETSGSSRECTESKLFLKLLLCAVLTVFLNLRLFLTSWGDFSILGEWYLPSEIIA